MLEESAKIIKLYGNKDNIEIFVKIKNHLGCCYRRLGDLKEAKRNL